MKQSELNLKTFGSAKNLMRVYREATDWDKLDGMSAYFRYNLILEKIADEFGFKLDIVCAVFSALSPNNTDLGNLKDTIRLLRAAKCCPEHPPRVHTYHQNRDKAWKIAQPKVMPFRPEEWFKTKKTESFFHNLRRPWDEHEVTIDGHMYWAWMYSPGKVKSGPNGERMPTIDGKLYDMVADDVRGLAKALNILPSQFQAIIWHTWKRINNRVYSPQEELMPTDFFLTGFYDCLISDGQTFVDLKNFYKTQK